MTITIPGQIIKMDTETGIDPVWYDKLKAIFASANLFASDAGVSSRIAASLGADVALVSTGGYFDGPSIAQGTAGTWFVSGSVSLLDTAGACSFFVKLWDGTTVISSCFVTSSAANFGTVASLSGVIASPAGNLKISVRDPSTITGKVLYNTSGNSKDSTISAFRIA